MKIRELTYQDKVHTDAYDIEQVLRKAGFNWVLSAEIENAVLEIRDKKLYWYAGQWFAGQWVDGIWLNGSFRSGDWQRGVWHNGTFYGTWQGGVWVKGSFKGTWNSDEDSPLKENIILSFTDYLQG